MAISLMQVEVRLSLLPDFFPPSTIAALVDFTPVSVENPVSKIRQSTIIGQINDQKLVETDTTMSVRKFPDILRPELEPLEVLSDRVDDHEIVAESVHLREFQHFELLSRVLFQPHFSSWLLAFKEEFTLLICLSDNY